MTRARAVVEVIAKALVDAPADVVVHEREQRGTTLLELELASDEFGRLIGRQGRTAMALRTLAGVVGEADGQRVQVEFRERHRPRR
ncbi:MAG: KH domain-containing protein [Vicinamibacterales bacterium]